MSRLITFTLSLFVIALACSRASACGCSRAGTPCRALEGVAAVFVGTVTSVSEGARGRKPDGELDFTPRLVRLSVEQSFLGAPGAEAEIGTGLGDDDCGYPFMKGFRYLVYAYKGEKDGRLYTSACTRTRRAAAPSADEDLRYLRGLATGAPRVSVSGKVMRVLSYAGPGGERPNLPMEGAVLSVEGEAQTQEARTDALGRFRLTGLRPGTLTLRLRLADELEAYKSERLLKFAFGGCASEDFYVVDNGRIGGRVFDAEGAPMEGVGVVVLGTTGWNTSWYARTDAEGRYKVSSVPPGQYMVGINVRGLPGSIEADELPADFICPNCNVFVDNFRPVGRVGGYPRVFYPGVFRTSRAGLVSVSVGQELRDVDLRLPPRPVEAVVKGRVLRADGAPAAFAAVYFREVTYEDMIIFNYGIRADERGEFSFKTYTGGRYVVEADYQPRDERNAAASGATEPLAVFVTKPEESVTLVVKRFTR